MSKLVPPLEWARRYHRRGWRPVPAPYRRKHPVLDDADLDAPEACTLGPLLLPPTAAVFGRQSKPRSHHLYVAKDPAIAETIQDLDWPGKIVDGKPVRILELR